MYFKCVSFKVFNFSRSCVYITLSSTHTYNCQVSTTTRNRFVKFSLDGCCGEKVEFTRDICQRKPSTGCHRTDPTLATMIKRNGFVRFSVDGRCGQKKKLTSRRVPRTCVISTTKASGVINHVVKTGKPRKKKRRNRTCACGDIYCNYISTFLGTMITAECSYANPNEGNRTPNKQFRCEKIHKQLVMFRKVRNDLFTTQVPPDPPKNTRFNEIHYPILFLIREVKMCKSKRRIPETLDVDVAKETMMFKPDLVRYDTHFRKKRVVVVPTLNAHEAIQARIMS